MKRHLSQAAILVGAVILVLSLGIGPFWLIALGLVFAAGGLYGLSRK
jgi:hypothetical protein